METSLSPLALASTDDLVKELQGRFNACLFVGVRPIGGNQNELFHFDWQGSLTAAIGMSERAKARLLEIALASPGLDDDDEA